MLAASRLLNDDWIWNVSLRRKAPWVKTPQHRVIELNWMEFWDGSKELTFDFAPQGDSIS